MKNILSLLNDYEDIFDELIRVAKDLKLCSYENFRKMRLHIDRTHKEIRSNKEIMDKFVEWNVNKQIKKEESDCSSYNVLIVNETILNEQEKEIYRKRNLFDLDESDIQNGSDACLNNNYEDDDAMLFVINQTCNSQLEIIQDTSSDESINSIGNFLYFNF